MAAVDIFIYSIYNICILEVPVMYNKEQKQSKSPLLIHSSNSRGIIQGFCIGGESVVTLNRGMPVIKVLSVTMR